MIGIRRGVQQRLKRFSVLSELVIQLDTQILIHPTLSRELVPEFFKDRMLYIHLESKVIKKAIDSIDNEAPAFVCACVARVEHFNELQHRLTIDLKQSLG